MIYSNVSHYFFLKKAANFIVGKHGHFCELNLNLTFSMHYDEDVGRGEFLWTHTTSSMGIAFQTTADKVHSFVLFLFGKLFEVSNHNKSNNMIIL